MLAATWGLLLGMLSSACSNSFKPGQEPAILRASLAAPPGTTMRQPSAALDEDLRRRIPAYLEMATEPSTAATLVSLAVDDSGRAYTLDVISGRVLVFDTGGSMVATWGDAGDGALAVPAAVAVANGQVFVADLNPIRLSMWGTDGRYLGDGGPNRFIGAMTGLGDGVVVARLMGFGPLAGSVSGISLDGDEVVRYAELPTVEALATDYQTRLLWPDPTFAAATDRVYVTSADAYEVLAFDVEGDLLWALRVPWPRAPIPEDLIQRSLERSRRAGRAMRTNVADMTAEGWPEYFPALSTVAADGAGRLYVFPFVRDADTRSSFPVDVYSPAGDLLLNGALAFQGWDAARGDTVYRLEEADGVARIMRYRIELPLTDPSASPAARIGH